MSIVIPLTQGQQTKVDDHHADLAKLKWYVYLDRSGHYYAHRMVNRKTLILSRIILERILGRSLEKWELADHWDGDTLNNLDSNIRLVDASKNAQNSNSHRDSISKFKGVSWDKSRGKWLAQIYLNGKNKNLGRFEDEYLAGIAYNRAAKENFGEFAKLNDIPDYEPHP